MMNQLPVVFRDALTSSIFDTILISEFRYWSDPNI